MGSSGKIFRKRHRIEEKEEEMEFDLSGNSDDGIRDDIDVESDGEDDEEMGDDVEREEVGDAVEGDVGNAELGDEMEQLYKECNSIRNEDQSLLKDLQRHKEEDIMKGQAVKNQKVLWDKSLELRFLLQKPFSNSNMLPKEPLRSLFVDSDDAVNQAYSDLISTSEQTLDCLLELQKSLIDRVPSIHSPSDEGLHDDVDGQDDETWLHIHKSHARIIPFRNSAIDKWHRKTQVTSGSTAFKGKLRAFNQNISEQVASYMRDPSRMINGMQLKYSTVGLLGVDHQTLSSRIEEDDVSTNGDPDLIDDSEFYQKLLKEFFESCDSMSSESVLYEMKRLQPKKRKMVDRRASKSRKIRYNVHDKIANFMAPKTMRVPEMASKLFENLFGLRDAKQS
ncbi:putative Protein BFR2 [Zostera marina]|uniref:Protein AATF n=1 Tax=Zostera marina TaxID=29655 RepID=A0A0K9NIM3_ZOSMR|nr:putative Protein BFR2 [Zostera marina]